jgi:hypothetical protein
MVEGHVASSRDAPEYHYALLFAFCFAESKIPLLFWWSIPTSAGWWNRLNCQEIYNTRSFWLPFIAFSFQCVCLITKSLNAFDYALVFLCFGVQISHWHCMMRGGTRSFLGAKRHGLAGQCWVGIV